ncbi:helix-turn-helix transcriptional regulator [Erwinia aphidicola]|uniref:helix-turn-helix transcriptional regulator n=1 Tax=Erwinia aphidicola TaxID=68334 RepID=UPI0030169113
MNIKEKDSAIERIIKPFISFWEGSNEPWWVKNSKSQFVYANKRMRDFIGLPAGYDLLGRYDGELPVPVSEFEKPFQAHDRMVEKVKDRVTSIGIQRFDGHDYLQAWYTEKVPLMDEVGNVLGVIPHCRPVEAIFITRLAKIKVPTSLVFTPPTELFTDKEWEIIFYICQSFTPKMIEAAIGVPNRTVEDILCRIYKKSGVGNKRGLIDYCIEHGFNNFIPQSIFQSSDSIMPFEQ